VAGGGTAARGIGVAAARAMGRAGGVEVKRRGTAAASAASAATA